MEQEQGKQPSTSGQALVDTLLEQGAKAFDPASPDCESKSSARRAYDVLINDTGTINIMAALNKLIHPRRAPEWLRSEFVKTLTLLPMRPDGVRAILEFVFAVHPSTSAAPEESSSPQKQGANITQEALQMATQLLATPPAYVTAEEWFAGISPQLLHLLDGRDGLDLVRVSSYVIGFGILGRRKFGAPGSPGWKAFTEPMLSSIDPSLRVINAGSEPIEEEIVDLTKDTVIVSPNDLSQGVRRLQALILSHPNPGLSRRLLSPVLLPLWALASWHEASPQCEEDYCLPARNLLKILIKIAPAQETIPRLIHNLLYDGNDKSPQAWQYQPTPGGFLQAVARDRPVLPAEREPKGFDIGQVQSKSQALVDLVDSVSTEADVADIFLQFFGRWVAAHKKSREISFTTQNIHADGDMLDELVQAQVLQNMMEKMPEKLVSQPGQILQLVDGIFADERDNASAEDTIALSLSLLNLVVTSPDFDKSKLDGDLLASIEVSLGVIGQRRESELSSTAKSLFLLLKYHDDIEPKRMLDTNADQQSEDRKTYSLALSYITQTDSPAPVRVEGINLIQGLITSASPVLDIPAVLVLMSSLLEDNEDYINLKVIKVFQQLANKHPQSVTKELLDHYVDTKETASVDGRLRFGEALLQVIERLGETFTGETAQQVGEALLAMAGRRGHRPKTKVRQARADRARDMKKRKAEESMEHPSTDEDEDVGGEEKAQNALLEQIVKGWDSSQGTEDVRIRASALSVFGTGIESNVIGLGPTLVSTAVDLSISILTLEPEPEKGILRRSAVMLMLSFVKALDHAKEVGKRLGFGLTEQSRADMLRILEYIAGTDNDGLVKQHALDVIESLDNWQMSLVLSEVQGPAPELQRLAGLAINPLSASSAETTSLANNRPRIEEIE